MAVKFVAWWMGLALLLPAGAFARDAEEARRLKAENELLRKALADSRAEAEALRAKLAETRAEMDQARAQMQDQLQQMRQQMAAAEAARRAGKSPASPEPAPKGEPPPKREPPPKPAPPKPPLSHTLDIRVEKGDWGDASPADIRKVLLSAAGELWKHFPRRRLAPVIVRRGKSGPITLDARGPRGEYVVKLDVDGRYWSQFAYQFAHEFCHVLTNYARRVTNKNQWFEESLAEAASLYVVAEMGRSWRTAPPYPHWKDYAASLAKYAAAARRRDSTALAPGQTLAQWYRLNEGVLRRDPYDRRKNRLVAKQLLPLLEAAPARWEAVGFLNLARPDAGASFASYLAAWHGAAPAKHKPFVEDVAKRFGIRLAGRQRAAAG